MGFKSYVLPVTHVVTTAQKMMSVRRCQTLLNQLKTGRTGIIFFTHEKVFGQDIHVNRRNSRVIARSADGRDNNMVFRSKHPASVMVFGLVASDGHKMPLIMFEPKFRLNTECYLDVLNQAKEWILAIYPEAASEGEG